MPAFARRGIFRQAAARETRRIVPPVGVTDPSFASVVLLLDFAGSDGGTDITDLSNSNHVDTFVGNAQIDTAVQYLGVNTSLFDGDGDRIEFPDSADWDIGTGDFTIEIGVLHAGTNTTRTFISTYDPPDGWWLQRTVTNLLRFGKGDTVLYTETWAITNDTQYSLAVSRQGANLRVFVDGVQLGATVTDSTDLTGGATGLRLGMIDAVVLQPFHGNLGAVRVTKGVARFTANFTPPTVFYPTS